MCVLEPCFVLEHQCFKPFDALTWRFDWGCMSNSIGLHISRFWESWVLFRMTSCSRMWSSQLDLREASRKFVLELCGITYSGNHWGFLEYCSVPEHCCPKSWDVYMVIPDETPEVFIYLCFSPVYIFTQIQVWVFMPSWVMVSCGENGHLSERKVLIFAFCCSTVGCSRNFRTKGWTRFFLMFWPI